MIVLGITGGIGSGKSLVASILSRTGIPVYYADDRARALMNTNPTLIEAIKDLLGQEAYSEDGTLNRAFVGAQVFGDSEKLTRLNAIVHPATGKDFYDWVENCKSAGHPLVAKEAAILFESGAYLACDQVVTVYAPSAIRIERVMNRDGASREEVLARMSKQWSEWKKIRRSDWMIINDGNHTLIPQVLEMRRAILKGT